MLRVMNRNSGARMELFCYMFAIWIQIVWTVRTKRIARQTSAHLVIFVAKVDSASRIRGSLMRNQIVPTVMTKGLKNANNILNVNFTNSRIFRSKIEVQSEIEQRVELIRTHRHPANLQLTG
uniref:Uncharacterized protein n=1 Tax=Strigamia maritima TaxID=126957 RepID=T1JA14_STRMM